MGGMLKVGGGHRSIGLLGFGMGKNQAYKAMQRARVGSGSGGPEEVEDGMVDGSFHSPEWHAARLASLKTSHTITWEEYKQKQKEDLLRQGELEKDTDKLMREYRAQLDADRARKLSHGRNHHDQKPKFKKTSSSSSSSSRKRTKHSRRRHSDTSSSSSDDDDDRTKRRSKSAPKKKKRQSKSSPPSHDGPVPLSRFFGSRDS